MILVRFFFDVPQGSQMKKSYIAGIEVASKQFPRWSMQIFGSFIWEGGIWVWNIYLTILQWTSESKDSENPEHSWYKYNKHAEIGVWNIYYTILTQIGLNKDPENPERSCYKYNKDAEIRVWNIYLTDLNWIGLRRIL